MRGDHVQGFTRQIDTKPAAVASQSGGLAPLLCPLARIPLAETAAS